MISFHLRKIVAKGSAERLMPVCLFHYSYVSQLVLRIERDL